MMWLSSVLLFVAFTSVLGNGMTPLEGMGDQFEQCGKGFGELDLEELDKESGDAQMEIICPIVLDAFRCVDDIFERELDSSLEETADLIAEMVDAEEEPGKTVVKGLRVAVNTKSMLTDLCTEGTQLNIDVKADMQCFESIDEDEAAYKCRRKADVLDIFADMSNEIEEADSDFEDDINCRGGAFMAACISFLVHEECGQRAFNTFNTIVKRTTIFPNLVCSKEKLEEMKTTVIDKLNMPETEKNIFKLALDLKRRRK